MKSRRGRGFTLLEVLVATAIMGIAVVSLLAALSTSMRNAARLTDHDRMALLARSKMDELLADETLPFQGGFEGRFSPAESAEVRRVIKWFSRWRKLPRRPRLALGFATAGVAGVVEGWGESAVAEFGGVSPVDDPSRMKMAMHVRRGFTLIEVLIATSLIGLLSLVMAISMNIALNSRRKANARIEDNRKMTGAQRAMQQQLNNFVPVIAVWTSPGGPGRQVPFFDGQADTMRFVSTYSLSDAYRGLPQILEFQVLPGEKGVGVRLIVNEIPYLGPYAAGARVAGFERDRETGQPRAEFLPIVPGPRSFVLADRLATCRFFYEEVTNQAPYRVWRPYWSGRDWPLAVRVDLTPLDRDASRLHPLSVTSMLRAQHLQKLIDPNDPVY